MSILKSSAAAVVLLICVVATLFFGTSKTNYVELTGEVDERTVREAVEAITEARFGDTVVIQVLSDGGKIFAIKRVMYAMDHSKAKVKVVVDVIAASAAAYLYVYADKQEISNIALLMFHIPSRCIPNPEPLPPTCTKITEKDTGGSVVATFQLHKKMLNMALQKHIITQEEYRRVEAGEDVFVEGKDINKRIAAFK